MGKMKRIRVYEESETCKVSKTRQNAKKVEHAVRWIAGDSGACIRFASAADWPFKEDWQAEISLGPSEKSEWFTPWKDADTYKYKAYCKRCEELKREHTREVNAYIIISE